MQLQQHSLDIDHKSVTYAGDAADAAVADEDSDADIEDTDFLPFQVDHFELVEW